MTAQPPNFYRDRRLTGFAATLAVHLALLGLWQFSGKVPDASNQVRKAIQWVDIAPPTPRSVPAPAAEPAADPRPAPSKRVRVIAIEPLPPMLPQPEAIKQPAPVPPPGDASYDILQQAKRDLGKIDKELKKEFKGPLIKKPANSPQIRLVKGIEEAYDMAPPKWYEAAKIKELIDPGGYGRRRYRVITAFGTHCVTQDSNHSPGAHLDWGKRVEPKMTNCPPNEQPATEQKWDR